MRHLWYLYDCSSWCSLLAVYMFLYSLTLNTMDDTTKCAVCDNNPCTCPVAPAEEIITPDAAVEVSETETPAEESAAQ